MEGDGSDRALGKRFAEAEALFHRALELPPERRDAWLEEAAADDELRTAVRELLAHHREDERLTDLDALAAERPPSTPPPPAAVGPYRILGELGRGGMGVVYEAERADVGKRVALKLSRASFLSRERVLRFEIEERVLARLQHPNVAQLHDAGVTADGTPWFAMEIVEGKTIVEHARDAGLGTRQRLELFLEVCAAVQHAHRSLVVHRDIKPSNVLVGSDGAVKLLDFGVAKLLEDAPSADLTRTESRIYTRGYAAPEQLRGEPVTTATDVYQLGALLYELLAGTPAFAVSHLSAYEAERRVLETEPPPPSRAARRSGGRGTALSPDLDAIALTALHRDPARRYPSAEAMAADVRRFLDGLPVEARPSTFAYRAGRFLRRHRFGAATAAAFAVLLAGSAVALALAQSQTARQRDLARTAAAEASREAAKAEQVTTFLLGLFEGSDPAVAQGDTLTAHELLERGVARADAFADRPEIHATLLATTGRIHLDLGNVSEAEALLRRALDVWGAVPEADVRTTAEARLGLGWALDLQGRYEESGRLYRSMAESPSLEGFDDLRARALYGLYRALHALERPEAADTAFRAWEAALATGPSRPDVRAARSMISLGQVLTYRGETERAEALLRRGVESYRALYGGTHPELGSALNALGSLYIAGPPTPAADSVTLEAIAVNRRLYPDGHPELSLALTQRAHLVRAQGRLAEAEALLRESLAMETRHPGQEGIYYVTRSRSLANVLAERGVLDEAEGRLRDVSAWWDRNFGPEYFFTMVAQLDLSAVLTTQRAYGEAEQILLAAYARLRVSRGESDAVTQRAASLLRELYGAWGRPEEAARWARSPEP